MTKYLKIIEKVAVSIGILLLFLVFLEIMRAYEILFNLHPLAGYGFLGLLVLLLVYVVYQVYPLFHLPSAPKRPDYIDGELNARARKKFTRFFTLVFERLKANYTLLPEYSEQVNLLGKKVRDLQQFSGDNEAFIEEIKAIEIDHVIPIVKILDTKAGEVVSDNVGIVSIGTALSPYRSVDFLIVLVRNIRMINQITRIYRTRPTTRETISIFYDIARVVAAVNLLNAMDQVWTGLGRHIPLLGTYGEAASEGLFSGLLTSVAGHAAIDRCRSYHTWSSEEAAKTYRGKLNMWGKDILSLMRRHGVQRLFGRKKKKENQEEDIVSTVETETTDKD